MLRRYILLFLSLIFIQPTVGLARCRGLHGVRPRLPRAVVPEKKKPVQPEMPAPVEPVVIKAEKIKTEEVERCPLCHDIVVDEVLQEPLIEKSEEKKPIEHKVAEKKVESGIVRRAFMSVRTGVRNLVAPINDNRWMGGPIGIVGVGVLALIFQARKRVTDHNQAGRLDVVTTTLGGLGGRLSAIEDALRQTGQQPALIIPVSGPAPVVSAPVPVVTPQVPSGPSLAVVSVPDNSDHFTALRTQLGEVQNKLQGLPDQLNLLLQSQQQQREDALIAKVSEAVRKMLSEAQKGSATDQQKISDILEAGRKGISDDLQRLAQERQEQQAAFLNQWRDQFAEQQRQMAEELKRFQDKLAELQLQRASQISENADAARTAEIAALTRQVIEMKGVIEGRLLPLLEKFDEQSQQWGAGITSLRTHADAVKGLARANTELAGELREYVRQMKTAEQQMEASRKQWARKVEEITNLWTVIGGQLDDITQQLNEITQQKNVTEQINPPQVVQPVGEEAGTDDGVPVVPPAITESTTQEQNSHAIDPGIIEPSQRLAPGISVTSNEQETGEENLSTDPAANADSQPGVLQENNGNPDQEGGQHAEDVTGAGGGIPVDSLLPVENHDESANMNGTEPETTEQRDPGLPAMSAEPEILDLGLPADPGTDAVPQSEDLPENNDTLDQMVPQGPEGGQERGVQQQDETRAANDDAVDPAVLTENPNQKPDTDEVAHATAAELQQGISPVASQALGEQGAIAGQKQPADQVVEETSTGQGDLPQLSRDAVHVGDEKPVVPYVTEESHEASSTDEKDIEATKPSQESAAVVPASSDGPVTDEVRTPDDPASDASQQEPVSEKIDPNQGEQSGGDEEQTDSDTGVVVFESEENHAPKPDTNEVIPAIATDQQQVISPTTPQTLGAPETIVGQNQPTGPVTEKNATEQGDASQVGRDDIQMGNDALVAHPVTKESSEIYERGLDTTGQPQGSAAVGSVTSDERDADGENSSTDPVADIAQPQDLPGPEEGQDKGVTQQGETRSGDIPQLGGNGEEIDNNMPMNSSLAEEHLSQEIDTKETDVTMEQLQELGSRTSDGPETGGQSADPEQSVTEQGDPHLDGQQVGDGTRDSNLSDLSATEDGNKTGHESPEQMLQPTLTVQEIPDTTPQPGNQVEDVKGAGSSIAGDPIVPEENPARGPGANEVSSATTGQSHQHIPVAENSGELGTGKESSPVDSVVGLSQQTEPENNGSPNPVVPQGPGEEPSKDVAQQKNETGDAPQHDGDDVQISNNISAASVADAVPQSSGDELVSPHAQGDQVGGVGAGNTPSTLVVVKESSAQKSDEHETEPDVIEPVSQPAPVVPAISGGRETVEASQPGVSAPQQPGASENDGQLLATTRKKLDDYIRGVAALTQRIVGSDFAADQMPVGTDSLDTLQEQIEQLLATRDNAFAPNIAAEEQLEELRRNLREAQAELHDLRARGEGQDVPVLGRQNEELQRQLLALAEKEKMYLENLQHLRDAGQALAEKNGDLDDRCQELLRANVEATVRRDALEIDVEALAQEKAVQAEKIREQEEELNRRYDANDSEKFQLREQLSAEKRANTTLTRELARFRRNASLDGAEITRLLPGAAAHTTEIKQMEPMKKENESLLKATHEQEQALHKLQQEKADLEKDLAAAQKEVGRTKVTAVLQKRASTSSFGPLSNIPALNKDEKKAVDKLQREKSQLESDLEAAKKEIAELNLVLGVIKEELAKNGPIFALLERRASTSSFGPLSNTLASNKENNGTAK